MAIKVIDDFPARFSEITEGETLRETSAKCDIGMTTVSNYKSGIRSPKIHVVKHIAQIYNVNPLWLAGYDVPKHEVRTTEDADSTARYIYENVRAMTPEQQQAVRLIVDQVLALRGDK